MSPALQKISGLDVIKIITHNWSVTQSLDVTQQLKTGVRYFDVRVGAKSNSDELHSVHGLYGSKVHAYLEEINVFLDEHPKEIVLLDFNHFYDANDNSHSRLKRNIFDTFGSKLCPFVELDQLSLCFMWECNLQVIVFYHCNHGNEPQLWPGTAIRSLWPNVKTVDELLDEDTLKRNEHMDKFQVTQGVLTPDTQFVVFHIGATLKNSLCVQAAEPFVRWLKTKKPDRYGVNICMIDFVEMADYISTVINLNYSLKVD